METFFLNKPLSIAEQNYAIIDRVIYPDIAQDFPVLEIVTPIIQPQAHLYPYLLPLKTLPLTLWQQFNNMIQSQIKQSKNSLSILLIKSDDSTESLIFNLANYLIHSFKQRNYILRYYDPKVFVQLCWILGRYGLNTLSKVTGVYDWTFYINQQWNTLSITQEEPKDSTLSEQLNYEQLKNIGLINTILSKYFPFHSIFEHISYSQKISLALQQAESNNVTNREDKLLFAQHYLFFGQEFLSLPIIQKILNNYEEVGHYSEQMSKLTKLDWLKIYHLLGISVKGELDGTFM